MRLIKVPSLLGLVSPRTYWLWARRIHFSSDLSTVMTRGVHLRRSSLSLSEGV